MNLNSSLGNPSLPSQRLASVTNQSSPIPQCKAYFSTSEQLCLQWHLDQGFSRRVGKGWLPATQQCTASGGHRGGKVSESCSDHPWALMARLLPLPISLPIIIGLKRYITQRQRIFIHAFVHSLCKYVLGTCVCQELFLDFGDSAPLTKPAF